MSCNVHTPLGNLLFGCVLYTDMCILVRACMRACVLYVCMYVCIPIQALYDEVKAMREACGDAHLKTILATGHLGTLTNVYKVKG